MNSDEKLLEQLVSVSHRYLNRFGEAPPTEELPAGLQESIDALEKALADGKPYDPDIPPGAVT